MKLSRLSQSPTWLVLVLLAAITILSHAVLMPVGVALHNTEWANFLLWADRFRQGEWAVFPYRQNYAGMTLSALRAGWSALFEAFAGSGQAAYLNGHMSFSYIICPLIATLLTYYLVLAYCSRAAAFVVGLVVAFGIQAFVYIYGDDFHPMLLWLGMGMMILRARAENPFIQFSPRLLFFTGLLCGHALYTLRAAQLYILVLFFPFAWFGEQLKWLQNKIRTNKLAALAGILFAFGLAIEVFGRELGSIAGRMVKLDGEPNIKIGVAILGLIWLRDHGRTFRREHFKRAAILGVGVLIGYLPELLYWLARGRLTSDRVFASHDFPMMMHILGLAPETLRSLVSGNIIYRGLAYRDESIGQWTGIVLMIWSSIVFVGAMKRNRKLWGLALLAVLAIFAYCRVNTQYTEVAPIRYLFPLFPFLLVSFGVLWDYGAKQPRTKLAVILVLALFSANHLDVRARFIRTMLQSGYLSNLQAMVETFEKADVDFVITDDLWHSGNLSVLSGGKMGFWASWQGWGPLDHEAKAKQTRRAGILLETKPGNVYPVTSTWMMGKTWKLKPLAQIGDRQLYLGEAQ